jgi:hypothetical protein
MLCIYVRFCQVRPVYCMLGRLVQVKPGKFRLVPFRPG